MPLYSCSTGVAKASKQLHSGQDRSDGSLDCPALNLANGIDLDSYLGRREQRRDERGSCRQPLALEACAIGVVEIGEVLTTSQIDIDSAESSK
jgi:hypothetical protein